MVAKSADHMPVGHRWNVIWVQYMQSLTECSHNLARHDIVWKLIIDNVPNFASAEFAKCSRELVLEHIMSSPHYPKKWEIRKSCLNS